MSNMLVLLEQLLKYMYYCKNEWFITKKKFLKFISCVKDFLSCILLAYIPPKRHSSRSRHSVVLFSCCQPLIETDDILSKLWFSPIEYLVYSKYCTNLCMHSHIPTWTHIHMHTHSCTQTHTPHMHACTHTHIHTSSRFWRVSFFKQNLGGKKVSFSKYTLSIIFPDKYYDKQTRSNTRLSM